MPSPDRPVRKILLLTHGRPEQVGDGVSRLLDVARRAGVEVVIEPEEAAKHSLPPAGDAATVDLALVLGGDGTMLRGLQRQLGTGIPVLGVNFGRVGFLCSITPDDLERGVERALAGDLETVELPTLTVAAAGVEHVAVNDVVVTSGTLGRMVELEWSVGSEELGRVSCDGLICATPSGSTAYNLSNGGPLLMWGLDAAAVTFVAPHSLHARPLVVPRERRIVIENCTADVDVVVLVDGHQVGSYGAGERIVVELGPQRSLLGTLPEATFVSRYRTAFGT